MFPLKSGAGDFDTEVQRVGRAHKAVTTLLDTTVVIADATTNATAVSGFGGFKYLTVLLTLSAKTMDASTTMDVYIQASPDDGTTWDDVISFSQITNAAIPNGTYVARVSNNAAVGFIDRANRNGTLTANTIVEYFTNKLRVKYVSTNFSGSDTLTLKVQAIATP